MAVITATCTGCSLLCDDIEVDLKEGTVTHVKNLCRKGHGHFQAASTERMVPMIEGQKVSLDQAIARAAEMLRNAARPLLYGWSNCTMEAQAEGMKLAEKLGATIDDTSSFGQGPLMERILDGRIATCTLDDVRNYADTSIFWGADPSNSHPRHLSRFSYYPRGEKRQRSYEEERTCIAVDVRRSPTVEICSDYYFRVAPGGDAGFMEAVLSVLDGKIPRVDEKKKMIELGSILKKTEFGVIFPGSGMISSLQGNMDLFERLLIRLNEIAKFRAIPMVGRYNERGFNEMLREKTGFINRVSFKGGSVAHGPEHGVIASARSCDVALVIGSDPLSTLPAATASALAKKPLIVIDPRRSMTTDAASVTLPSAISGLEAGGSAVRMDGVRVKFEPFLKTDLLADEQILSRIREAI